MIVRDCIVRFVIKPLWSKLNTHPHEGFVFTALDDISIQ